MNENMHWKHYYSVAPAMRTTVYCNGVRNHGRQGWDFLWNKIKIESDASEVYNIIAGLACAEETWLINR